MFIVVVSSVALHDTTDNNTNQCRESGERPAIVTMNTTLNQTIMTVCNDSYIANMPFVQVVNALSKVNSINDIEIIGANVDFRMKNRCYILCLPEHVHHIDGKPSIGIGYPVYLDSDNKMHIYYDCIAIAGRCRIWYIHLIGDEEFEQSVCETKF